LNIYKPCDIRGHDPTDLSPELYRRWGQALGEQLRPGSKFVVGGDVRLSTPGFLAGLAEGLMAAGCDVVDLGVLPTPMIYYAKRRLRADGCAIVTASHNPADYNGLKWMLGDRPPTPEQVAVLADRVAPSGERSAAVRPGTQRKLDISHDYVGWLQETWVEGSGSGAAVVLDPMHGCWAGRARRYLQAVFPRAVFSAIHDESDAVFAGRVPDCSRPDGLECLCRTVDHQRADLGIAFDGDGDRVAFVDGEGTRLTAEEATCVMLETFGEELCGETFVHDVKFSDRVAEAAGRLGGTPLAERSGHAFLRARMLDTGAVFGAEMSGHYFFRALEGGDDGLFAACWLIDYLAHSGRCLAELRRGCPRVYATPDLRVPMGGEEAAQVFERVRTHWSDCPQSTTDGIRVDFSDGWALVRRSVTEPALTFRFEAGDDVSLARLVYRFCQALPQVGDGLWERYDTWAVEA